MKKYLFVLLAMSISLTGFSQDLKIGVRTGLTYYKLLGPLETNERQNFSEGFLFGITGQYNISESFGLRAELSYVQKSSEQEYSERFLTVVKNGDTRIPLFGSGLFTIKKTFNVFSIPLHAVYKPFRKFEIFGGVDIDFIAGVNGQGNQRFESNEYSEAIGFVQTFNHNYGNNLIGEFVAAPAQFDLLINYDADEDGVAEIIALPRSTTAYYYFDYIEDEKFKAFKSFDVALSGGASFYINQGLYIRATLNYGLRDSTNEDFDYSLQEVRSDGTFIFRDDYDRKIGGQLSIGFQF